MALVSETRKPVRAAAEITTRKCYPLLVRESAVVGRDDINRTVVDSTPQGVLFADITQRWAENKFQCVFA